MYVLLSTIVLLKTATSILWIGLKHVRDEDLHWYLPVSALGYANLESTPTCYGSQVNGDKGFQRKRSVPRMGVLVHVCVLYGEGGTALSYWHTGPVVYSMLCGERERKGAVSLDAEDRLCV